MALKNCLLVGMWSLTVYWKYFGQVQPFQYLLWLPVFSFVAIRYLLVISEQWKCSMAWYFGHSYHHCKWRHQSWKETQSLLFYGSTPDSLWLRCSSVYTLFMSSGCIFSNFDIQFNCFESVFQMNPSTKPLSILSSIAPNDFLHKIKAWFWWNSLCNI